MKYKLLSTRHAKYLIHAHIVFTSKYRKKIFKKEHLDYMQEVFRKVCNKFNAELVEFNGESDHVLLLVIYPPKVVSSRLLRKRFEVFRKEYWGEDVARWSRSYFAASVGGAPLTILQQYIKQQNAPQ